MKTDRKRGRPRTFDEAETLDRVMQVFWENGYSATSLDQISAATGLNRPSLYAAFGSKKDMYLKVVTRFADQMQSHLAAAAGGETTLRARIRATLFAAIDLYTGHTVATSSRYGCLVIATLPAEAIQDTDFREALNRVMGRMDRGFGRMILADRSADLEEAESEDLGRHIATLLHGISIRARAGEDPDTLKSFISKALDRILPPSIA